VTTPGPQRLFFALWPDSKVRSALARLGGSIQGHGGRPVHPEDIHLTLVFLGGVTGDRFGCVTEAAGGVIAPAFDLSLDRVGYWPRPRVLWCGCHPAPEPLLGLVDGLEQPLRTCGFRPEQRPYQVHLTLARKAHRVAGFELEHPIAWSISEFVLAGSEPGGPPPRYRILRRWPLGQG
jgi:2'-5' RNA ligase